MKIRSILVLVLAGAAGCDAGEQSIPPETLNARRAAYRQACAAAELATRSQDDIDTIEGVLDNLDPADPLASINRAASTAALQFARAYAAHADLRSSAYAYLDSAVNYATTTADSARYLERASAISVRAPAPGSLEDNVMTSYEQDLVSVLQNPDHACNWDLPF